MTSNKGNELLQILEEIRMEKNVDMAHQTKRCSKCGKDLPATDEYFYKDKRAKTGLTSWCRQCQRDNLKGMYARVKVGEANLDNVVVVDFTGYDDLFSRLSNDACDELRSLGNQILWLIKNYCKQERY